MQKESTVSYLLFERDIHVKKLFLMSLMASLTVQLTASPLESNFGMLESAIKSGSYTLVQQLLKNAYLSSAEKKSLLTLAEEAEEEQHSRLNYNESRVATFSKLKNLGTGIAIIAGFAGTLTVLAAASNEDTSIIKVGAGLGISGAAMYGGIRLRQFAAKRMMEINRKFYSAYDSAVHIKNYLTMMFANEKDQDQ